MIWEISTGWKWNANFNLPRKSTRQNWKVKIKSKLFVHAWLDGLTIYTVCNAYLKGYSQVLNSATAFHMQNTKVIGTWFKSWHYYSYTPPLLLFTLNIIVGDDDDDACCWLHRFSLFYLSRFVLNEASTKCVLMSCV